MNLNQRSPRSTLILLALVLACALLAPAGAFATGSAGHAAELSSAGPSAVEAGAGASCLIHSLPSFLAQGEFATTATVADVVEVECNPFVYGTGSEMTISAGQLFSRCGGAMTWYVPNPFREEVNTRSVTLTLDADGNATVALIAGPGCQAGESLISAHMDDAPFESFTTAFTVLPPGEADEGVRALPGAQVEDAESSAAATIIQASFPGGSEKKLRIGSEEMLSRCRMAPKIHWVREDRTRVDGAGEVNGLELDNDGNAFLLLIGDASCYPGTSLIEADLESKPFTTLTTEFTILPPQPTEEPAFAIEKLQRIAGTAGGFTISPLTGAIGDTVEYEIVVSDTAKVDETIGDFTDPHCDPGTIAGGPGSSPLAPGQSTTFTCQHLLTTIGTYTNQATATATSAGGNPLQLTSNEVEVKVPPLSGPREPSFTIEKLQQISGVGAGFTTSPLAGLVGQTVSYEIVVKDTGNEPLEMSDFLDPHCDAGTIEGGPGASPLALGAETTYTCRHLLTVPGTYVNEATVTGTPSGESPITHTSEPVEVTVLQGEASFTIKKLQRIGSSGSPFTASRLITAVGKTVEYEIVVANTGNEPLTLSGFTDAHCDPSTIAGGPASAALAPGESATYTCNHVLAIVGPYINEATVTAAPPGEAGMTLSSPKVEVVAEKEPITPGGGTLPTCTAKPVLKGVTGPKRRPFKVSVSAAGIARITFYLDGRRLRTLKSSQAKKGVFTITVDPRKLAAGRAHKVSFTTVMSNPGCATTASARMFVRPRNERMKPTFAG
jgi:hypothetical protein